MFIKNFFLKNKGIKQTVFKNVFWIAMAAMIQKVVGFIVIVWIARHFGPTVYGQWSFALSFVIIFSVLANFGFDALTIREIARDQSGAAQYIDNIFAMKLLLGSATFVLIVFVARLLNKGPEVIKLIYFLGIYMVINTFIVFFQSIFRASQKMQYETVCRGIQALSLLGFVSLLILTKSSIIEISYAYVCAGIVGLLFSAIFTWRYFTRFSLKIDITVCTEILKKAWPFALSVIAITVYYRIDTVMLGVFKDDQAVGYYGAAYTIILLIIGGISFLMNAIFPSLSILYKSSMAKFKDNVNLYFKMVLLLSVPLVTLVFCFSKTIVNVIYGNKFAEFTPLILQILVWSVLLLYTYAIYSVGLSASDKQKVYLKGVVSGAIFNVVANLLVIPKYTYYGAAVTTILTEILVGGYIGYNFLKLNEMKLPIIFIQKVLLSSLLMGLTIFFCIHFEWFSLVLSAIFGVIVYVLMIFILKAVKRNLWTILKT